MRKRGRGCRGCGRGHQFRAKGGPGGCRSNSFHNRLSGNNLLRKDSLLAEFVARAVECCLYFRCHLCFGLQTDTSVRPDSITTTLTATMQQYIPKIAFSDALLLPCYVTVTRSMHVHQALKRGVDWLRPHSMLQAVARQEVRS